MARPTKKGLLYFQTDVDMFQDRKIKRLIRTAGGRGFTIFFYLLTEIYRHEGYFLEWDEDTAFDVSDDLNEKESVVNETVKVCLSLGLFDKELATSGSILTSKSIQERWLKICKDANRKDTEINPLYDLLNKPPKKPSYPPKKPEFPPEESTQRIEKNNIENNSIEKESIEKEKSNDDFLIDKLFESEPSKLFIRYWRRNPSPQEIFDVKKLIEDHGIEDVKNSFHKAMEQGSEKMNIAYVKGIFKNLLKERFDLEQKERKQIEMKEAESDRKKDAKILSRKYQELWSRFRKIKDLLTPLEQDRLIQFLNTNQLDKAETKITELENESKDQPDIKTGTVESLALSMKIS